MEGENEPDHGVSHEWFLLLAQANSLYRQSSSSPQFKTVTVIHLFDVTPAGWNDDQTHFGTFSFHPVYDLADNGVTLLRITDKQCASTFNIKGSLLTEKLLERGSQAGT